VVRYRKIVGAVAILLVAAFGTIGVLAGAADPSGRVSLVVAGVGAVLWVQGLAVSDLRKTRLFLGAVGLLLVVVLGPIALFAFATASRDVPAFLLWIGLGLLLWCQAISAQTGLAFRATLVWLTAVLALILVIVVILAVGAFAVRALLGTGADGLPGSVFRVVLISVAGALVASWGVRHPVASSVIRAIGRALMARATPDDVRLLSSLARVGADVEPGATRPPE
jgi:hypothetical protein